MSQGEIWMADMNPIRGSEPMGVRPVVVISGNAMNDNLGISIICPLTTKIKNLAGCLVLTMDSINGLDADSEVITFQVRTLTHERLLRKLGVITPDQLDRIRQGLNEILTY